MTNKRLSKSIKKFSRKKEDRVITISGMLGLPLNGAKTVSVPNRDGFVFVRLKDNTSEVIQAYNSEVSPIYDLPVLVTRQGNVYKVIGRNLTLYRDWGSVPYLPKHGGQHSFNVALGIGGDITWVFSQQFMPLLGYPSGTSMMLTVEPHVYEWEGQWKYAQNTGTPSFAPFVPTSGAMARMALLYIDGRDNSLNIAAGASFSNLITDPATLFTFLPDVPRSIGIPIAGVKLPTGTTSLEWTNVYDVRDFYTVGMSSGSAASNSIFVWDEGVLKGTATTLNFIGNNVDVSISGTVARVFITGASGGSGVTQIISGSNLLMQWTGVDPGTGIVTLGMNTELINGFLTISDTEKQLEIGDDHIIPTRNSPSGTTIFNKGNQAGMDFQVRGNGDDNLIYVDTVTDRVGIGKNTPGYLLDVFGEINAEVELRVGGVDVADYVEAALANGNTLVFRHDNVLSNGGFRVAQRGAGPFTSATTPANNDDTYLLDGCILLSDGNDTVDVSQVADNDFVSGYKMRLDVETANRRFGILLPIENRDIQEIRKYGKASLQFKAKKTGTSVSNIRAYLLAWSSTADAITSDVISAWGSAGSDPTFATNWTAENTASNLEITTTVNTYAIENITVDTASITNLAVLIIVDDTDATVGDFIDIGDVKLESGIYSTSYINRPYQEDYDHCLRYLYVLRATDALSSNLLLSNTYNYTTTNARGVLLLAVPMRIQPAMSILTIGNWYVQANGANFAASAASLIGGFNTILWISVTMAAATAGHAGVFGTSTSTETVTLSAEL